MMSPADGLSAGALRDDGHAIERWLLKGNQWKGIISAIPTARLWRGQATAAREGERELAVGVAGDGDPVVVHHAVVPPAEQGEVAGAVGAAIGPPAHVVGVDPPLGRAPGEAAAAVAHRGPETCEDGRWSSDRMAAERRTANGPARAAGSVLVCEAIKPAGAANDVRPGVVRLKVQAPRNGSHSVVFTAPISWP